MYISKSKDILPYIAGSDLFPIPINVHVNLSKSKDVIAFKAGNSAGRPMNKLNASYLENILRIRIHLVNGCSCTLQCLIHHNFIWLNGAESLDFCPLTPLPSSTG